MIDPIQSVRGKVVIDAFRTIPPTSIMSGQEPRQTTSNVGHLNKPSIQALVHNLNRQYYSEYNSICFFDVIPPRCYISSRDHRLTESNRLLGNVGINIDYRKSEAEQGMLMNLHKKGWTEGLKLTDFEKHHEGNEESVKVSCPVVRLI